MKISHDEALDIQKAIISIVKETQRVYSKWLPKNTGYDVKDIRSCIFEGLIKSLNSYHLALQPLRGIEIEPLLRVDSSVAAKIISNEYLIYCKWGYLINVWMLIEELFRDIALYLNLPEKNNTSIKTIIHSCLGACSIDLVWENFFTIVRLIRNGAHYAGIHTNKKECGEYQWNGQKITFDFGKAIEGWFIKEEFLVVELQTSLIKLLEKLFESEKLNKAVLIPRIYCPQPLSLV